jgi:hypothetical protein
MYRDRVLETSISTGTTAFVLAGTITGRQTFLTAFGASSQTVAYCIEGTNTDGTLTGEWEVGTGTFNGSTGLTRTTVLASSNAGALVPFSAGSKNVFDTAPAAYLVPQGTDKSVAFNDAGLPGSNASFTYDKASNTVSFGNITGSALAMTIKPKTPIITETPGILTISGQSATKANTAGGSVKEIAGNSTGTALGGSLSRVAGSSVSNTGGSISDTAGTNTSSTATGAAYGLGGGSNAGLGGSATLSGGTSSTGAFGASWLASGGLASGIGGSNSFSGGAAGFGTNAAGGNNAFQPGLADGIGASGTNLFISTTSATQMKLTDDGTGVPQISVFSATPVYQQTTATASATRVAVIGTVANIGDTYDGYTQAQVVKALRNYGILA